ncbi:MAG TPA: acyl-CoA carboxylase epsilon subunit [Mycobacteriales bacterium]
MTDSPPLLRVVRGEPTAEELAALLAVLLAVLAARSGAASAVAAPRSAWADPARRLGAPRSGRGAWRGSALPR